MTEAILTINAGSSSLKLGLFAREGARVLASGQAGRIGAGGRLRLSDADGAEIPCLDHDADGISDHAEALDLAIRSMRAARPELTVTAVGHRVVHGGVEFTGPVEITPAVMTKIEWLAPFAPLHQPHNIAGIRDAQVAFPGARQVACFDTAFHRTHPFVNDTFALPMEFYDKGVRRYGFHGLSYNYIAGHLAEVHPDLAHGRVVVAHLGSGASICALHNGRSVASTMGFSALDGLPMGTRCGQLDPGVVLFLMQHEGMGADSIADLLYNRSGLLGLSGESNDMRNLETSDSEGAERAIDYFVFRTRREVGAMAAALGGIDALIFCGGIGENSANIRAKICEHCDWMGIGIDPASNADNAPVISTPDARVRVMVLPTNEDLVIARQTRSVLSGGTERRAIYGGKRAAS